ncbi:MAG: hypothetical protein IJ460_04575 [Clostridia bacterium]|nr:hypothetical protein [Clostridia bacterium]
MARKRERELVKKGYQTYNWSDEEIEVILNNRWPKDYEGHHMMSVNEYPQYIGDPNVIQWLPTR